MNFGFECFRKLFCCFPKIYGWGSNQKGQLGLASAEPLYKSDMPLAGTSPPTIGSQSDWVKVCSADGVRGYGILADGSLWGWGSEPVGDGTGDRRDHPVQIGIGHKWQDVSGSASHTLAVRQDGTLWAWGNNAILAAGAVGTHLSATRVPSQSDEAVRAVLSQPLSSAEPIRIWSDAGSSRQGKYTEKPTASVRQMSRDSESGAWTQQAVSEDAVVEAVMNYTILSVDVTNGGSGYTSRPSVTLEEDGGAIGLAEKNLAVSRVHVASAGTGYKKPPGVRFTGESSSAASAVVSKMRCKLKSIQLTSGGSGYVNPPRPEITDSRGNAQDIGSATISNGVVTGVTLSSAIFFYLMPGTYSVTFANTTTGGSGASAQVEVEGDGIEEVLVISGGNGYKEPPSVSFVLTDGGSGASAEARMMSVESVGVGNAVLTPVMSFQAVEVRVTGGGSGYTSRPSVTMPAASSGSSPATASVSKMGCLIESISVTSPGGGYVSPPVVTIDGQPSDGLLAVLQNGTVVRVDVAPGLKVDAESASIGFSGGGGSGATGQAVLRLNHVVEVAVQSAGEYVGVSGDDVAVSFSGPGSGAAAVAKFGNGVVRSVSVSSSSPQAGTPADGYREKPVVVFTGGGGSGAEAVAKVEGKVDSVAIKSSGNGYTVARFSHSNEALFPDLPLEVKARRCPFVFFARDSKDEFSDGEPVVFAGIPTAGVNAALFFCSIEPGPIHSLAISDAYSGQSPPPTSPWPPFSRQGTGRVTQQSVSHVVTPGAVLMLGSRQESLPLSGDSDGWEAAPWIVRPDGGGGYVTDEIRVGLDGGSPSPIPRWNLNFLSFSGGEAAGTVDTTNGWASNAILSSPGIGYASEPIVELDGVAGVFKQPVQIGESKKWKSVSAGTNYSLALDESGLPYWWGRVPLITPTPSMEATTIPRPERVGKRAYVTASPKDEYSGPYFGTGNGLAWIAPPPTSGGRRVSFQSYRQVKRPFAQFFTSKSSDEQGPLPPPLIPTLTLPQQYDGPYAVVMSSGTGYTEQPETRFSQSLPFTASVSLVGPDACRAVVAAGDVAFAIDESGNLWHLNSSAATHGDTVPEKQRLFLTSSSNKTGEAAIEIGAELSDGASFLGGVQRKWRLDDGGFGNNPLPTNQMRWSGEALTWYIVKRTVNNFIENGFWYYDSKEEIHSTGDLSRPDITSDVDVWSGSVTAPAWVTSPSSSLPPPQYPPVPPPDQNATYRLVVFRKSAHEPSMDNNASYVALPDKLRHVCVGPARIGSQFQWGEVTRAKIGRTSGGKLFFGVGENMGITARRGLAPSLNIHGIDVPGNPFPTSMQFSQLRIGGQSGVKESDQSLWLLGDSQISPPVVKGDVELKIEDAGSGYTEPAILKFSSQPAGVATASATLNGSVISVGVIRAGSGYRYPPTVSIEGGAECEAVIAGPVDSVHVTSGGSGYRTPPKVRFSQPGLSAQASATIKDGAVERVSVSHGGRYRAAPQVAFEPVPDVESINVTSGGSGYSSPPSVLVIGGGGSGCTASASIDGRVQTLTLTAGGSGYTSPPQVSFSGGEGQGASAIAGINSATGAVSGITILNPGSGYQSPPSVRISGGGGSGAAAIASIAGPVRDVSVQARGAGYERTPQVFFQGGGGTGAAATATTATLGSGAAATCKINGSVIYCKVTNGGSGYENTPVVSFAGGGNESLSSLESQLASGDITQEEFDASESQFRASGQARIKGGVSVSVDSGGEKYAWKTTLSNSGAISWYGAPLYEMWLSGVPYWRDGGMMSSQFWLHTSGGPPGGPPGGTWGGREDGDIIAPGIDASGKGGGLANTSTTQPPGGAITSMAKDPYTNKDHDFGDGWTQRPLVAFWNTHAIVAKTSLRVAAVAKKTGGKSNAKSIYSWPHSLQYLESLLNSSGSDIFSGDYSPTGGYLGFMWQSVADSDIAAYAVFASGGAVASAYLDGIVGGEFPYYGQQQGTAAVPPTGNYAGMRYKFSTPPTVSVECDVGTGASVVVNVDGNGDGTLSVVSGGSGYGSLARTVVSGGRPKIVTASAAASLSSGAVTSVAVTSQGSGYTSPPAVVIHGGGGSGATGTAVLSNDPNSVHQRVVSVTITSQGSGYTSPPSVSFVETDRDYADFAYSSPFTWRDRHEYGEPAGYRSRFVGLTGTKPEYFQILAGETENRVTISAVRASEDIADEVTAFYADGYLASATLASSHSSEARHPSLLKQLPPGVSVEVIGTCDVTASVSVTRPKWSNEMHGASSHSVQLGQDYGTTFAVRDTTQ